MSNHGITIFALLQMAPTELQEEPDLQQCKECEAKHEQVQIG